MPQPTLSQVHVDSLLTNLSVAYLQNLSDYVGTQIFPVVRVSKKSGLIVEYPKGDWLRDEAQVRAPGTESAGGGYNINTTAQYNCVPYAFHKDVADQIRANSDLPLDDDRDATEFVVRKLALRQEVSIISTVMSTGNWDTEITGATAASTSAAIYWSDYTASDPITDLETAKVTVLSNTGFLPNTAVFSYETYRWLKHHPDIVDRFKYTSSNQPEAAALAGILEIPRILVAKSIRNTAVEGATASLSFNSGKHAWIGYVSPTPSRLAPSAGYTFAWDGVSGGLGQTVAISKFRMEHLKADRIEGEVAFDVKILGSDLGYLFKSITT